MWVGWLVGVVWLGVGWGSWLGWGGWLGVGSVAGVVWLVSMIWIRFMRPKIMIIEYCLCYPNTDSLMTYIQHVCFHIAADKNCLSKNIILSIFSC